MAQTGQMDYSKAWEQYYKKLGKSTHHTHITYPLLSASSALTDRKCVFKPQEKLQVVFPVLRLGFL